MEKENRTLEYKEIVNRKYLKTVSAFANYCDGMIIFGITDDFKTIGVDKPNDACLNIENQINDSIKPRPNFTLKINSDNTVSLFVKKGTATPYRYEGKAYKRSDSSTVEVDSIEEKRLIMSGMNITFEEVPCGIDKLDFTFLEGKLVNAMGLSSFNLDTLKSLNLYNISSGYNNAAAMLADTNDFPGIDIAVFGSSISIFKKRATLAGESIVKQYYDALEFYKDEYVVESVSEGFRNKVELIPFEAFREAAANAIIHRTWDINANTKIEMHPDKIIISSPGGLMAGMSKEDYISGNYSYLRNPIISNVFRRLNIIEAFATGIRRINESYRDSLSKPIYNVTEGAISITLPIINKCELSANEKKVMAAMEPNRSYGRQEIETGSGLAKDTLVRTLNLLLNKGLLEKTGKARSTQYVKK